MRGLTVLVGLFLLACGQVAVSAYAADKQIVVAAVKVKQAPVARVHPAAAVSTKASKIDEGDSRMNDYRLERESCCGPQ